MQVFLNGRFIPEAQAVVPITDRGFLYGDGLFETLRVRSGIPLWWDRHMARFQHGVEMLRLTLPWPAEELRRFAAKLIQLNSLPECILRLTVSRGSGMRGYSLPTASTPTVAISLHELRPPPDSLRIATASVRVSARDPLSSIKSANKLVQVLARAEAEERGADEAILLNLDGYVTEAVSGNIFCIADGTVTTPTIEDGALAGVTRGIILEICRNNGIHVVEKQLTRSEILQADGVFFTNSGQGIVPVSEIDAQRLKQSPLVHELKAWLEENEQRESRYPVT